MDSAYYALIYNYLTNKIEAFASDGMNNAIGWVTNFALILVTLWVFFRGYRIATGQSQESLMATVSHMIKISLIVFVAKTMAFGSTGLYDFIYRTLPQQANQIVTGSDASPASEIDKNLILMSLASSAIDSVQVPPGDTEMASQKGRASLIASLGIAAPAMTAGALLLTYQIGLALIVGLGPLFILCLIFDQTKELFRRWLMHALGLVFSMAVLNAMIIIVMDLTERVAVGIWSADALTRLIGIDASPGFNTMAFQQGGVGLLMTVLIISTPPMAAALFGATVGQFYSFSQMSGANNVPARPGPYGQAPGTYGAVGHGGTGHMAPAAAMHADPGRVSGSYHAPQRTTSSAISPDAIKIQPTGGGQ